MSLLTVPPELCAKLNEPLPPEAIAPHPNKNYLSTIKTIFAVERLNQVFGVGGWTAKSEIVETNPSERLPPDEKHPDGKVIGGMIIVRVTLKVPYYGIELEQYGGNDNPDRGDAYKGAFTDALSKVCGYLGIGMDVYKGDGPTKSNPRGSKAALDAERDRKLKWAEESAAKRAAAKAVPANEPGLGPPHDQQLRDSLIEFPPHKKPALNGNQITVVEIFKPLHKAYKKMGMEERYYEVLAMNPWKKKKSTEFKDQEEAQPCINYMQLDVQECEIWVKDQEGAGEFQS